MTTHLPDSDTEDVILRRKPPLMELEEEKHEIGAAVERKRPMTKEDIQKMNLKKKTRKRTRKFEIDGVTVTTTTSKVIYRDEESETFYDEHYFRKQELRELKLLQKQEQKQFQDLAFKNQVFKEQQEKRFDTERITLMKNYENDLTSMIDGQKKQVGFAIYSFKFKTYFLYSRSTSANSSSMKNSKFPVKELEMSKKKS